VAGKGGTANRARGGVLWGTIRWLLGYWEVKEEKREEGKQPNNSLLGRAEYAQEIMVSEIRKVVFLWGERGGVMEHRMARKKKALGLNLPKRWEGSAGRKGNE